MDNDTLDNLKYWYNQFKDNKQVWARVKDQCPSLKRYSNRFLKRKVTLSNLTSLNITLPCGVVVTHHDLFTKGLIKYCDCCHVISEIYNTFEWVNYIIVCKETVKYIGHTTDLKQRLAFHVKHKKYIPETDKVYISVSLSEQTLFNWYRPELNKNERLNLLARVKENGLFVSKEILLDQTEKTINTITHIEKYIEEYNQLQVWCYDTRAQLCRCKIKCALRKYHNVFNNRPKYYPIDPVFVDAKYKKTTTLTSNCLPVENILNIYDTIRIRKPCLKPTTLKAIQHMSNVVTDLNLPFLCLTSLNKQYSPSTVKKIVGYILSYISVLTRQEKKLVFGKEYEKTCLVYYRAKFLMDKMESNEKQKGELTSIEQKNWVSFDVLKQVLCNLKEKDFQKYVILYLYMNQNALRSDFYNIKWQNINVVSDNFIDWENGYLILNHPLKIDKFQAYKLNQDTLRLLQTFKTTLSGDYLFVKKNGTPFNPKSFAQYLLLFIETELHALNIFHKRIGVQMLRKIVVSHQRQQGLNPVESLQLAKDMNHSEYMSKFYYCKNVVEK